MKSLGGLTNQTPVWLGHLCLEPSSARKHYKNQYTNTWVLSAHERRNRPFGAPGLSEPKERVPHNESSPRWPISSTARAIHTCVYLDAAPQRKGPHRRGYEEFGVFAPAIPSSLRRILCMHPSQGEMNPAWTMSGQVQQAHHGPMRQRPALDGANGVALFRGPLCIRISMPSDKATSSLRGPCRVREKKLRHGQKWTGQCA